MDTPRDLVWAPGDILVFSGHHPLSWLIRGWTCSPFSHVAIVAWVTQAALDSVAAHRPILITAADECTRPRWMLFESTSLGKPCEILGQLTEGSQAHDPTQAIWGYDGRVWRMRLAPGWVLTPPETVDLTARLVWNLGRRYDTEGAVVAGTRWLKRRLFARKVANRNTLQCVEYAGDALVYALRRRARLDCEPGAMSPREFVNYLLSAGVYGKPERIK